MKDFELAVDAAAQLAGASAESTPASGEAAMENMPAKLAKKVRRSIHALLKAEADGDEVDATTEDEEMPLKPVQKKPAKQVTESSSLAAADVEMTESEEKEVADQLITQANPSIPSSRSGTPVSFPIVENRPTVKHGMVRRSSQEKSPGQLNVKKSEAIASADDKTSTNATSSGSRSKKESVNMASVGASASVGPPDFQAMFPFEETRQGIKFRVPGTQGYFTFDCEAGSMIPRLHQDTPSTPVNKRNYAESGMSDDESEPCSKRHRDRIHLSAPFLVLQDQIPTPASYNVNMLVPIPRNNPFISLVDTSVEVVCRQEAGMY
jgi:hypothetical protein